MKMTTQLNKFADITNFQSAIKWPVFSWQVTAVASQLTLMLLMLANVNITHAS